MSLIILNKNIFCFWWPGRDVSYLSALVVYVKDKQGYDGYGELVFDSGEGALKIATTSKDGSRRENYPISTRRGSDKL